LHNNSLDVFSSASWLTNGKILLHPTEGVWGIGCDALNEKSFLRVYELKKRPRNKSFILLAKSLKEVKKYIRNSDDLDLNFINNIWPGPTTLLVDYNDNIPSHLKNNSGKIAIRVSNHYPIKALLKDFDGLFASTSANISGEPILQFPQEIIDIFANDNLAYYDEKLGKEMKPSTIIDLETKKILRH